MESVKVFIINQVEGLIQRQDQSTFEEDLFRIIEFAKKKGIPPEDPLFTHRFNNWIPKSLLTAAMSSSSTPRQQQQQQQQNPPSSAGDEHLKLASILSDLGAECCEKATLVDVLTQLGPSMRSKEAQIARALFMMCILPEEEQQQSGTHWSPPAFMLAVREAVRLSISILSLSF